jgi:UDP-3-O-[3-hydroxymyristoyl] N-acetylglucosamine deacetylase
MIDVTIRPLPIDSGIWFKRTDVSDSRAILAAAENVSDTSLATSIGWGQRRLSTLEHLMAALGGLGVNNIMVEINGPEAPILDGSAEPWVNLLNTAGFQILNAPRAYYRVVKPLKLTDGDKFLAVEPNPDFTVDFTIDFPGFIKTQKRHFKFSETAFANEISPARTFCLLKDVEMMKSQGKALGGGLDNAVVVGDDGILNPEGLRFQDECVRHKILDLIGDLSLAQAPIIGHFTGFKTGHSLNHKIVTALLNTPGYLEKVDAASPVTVKASRTFVAPLKTVLNPPLLGPDGDRAPIFAN